MALNYYQAQSVISDPKTYINLFSDLPTDISALFNLVRNLFLHYADFDLYTVKIEKSRYCELDLRYMDKILKKLLFLDNRHLTFSRQPNKRILGVCRDSALLLTSILRFKNIPARLRAGFASYFIPGVYLDGFCVEYYDESIRRWRYVDTRTSKIYIDHYRLKIDFDLTDVPETKFIVAPRAWQLASAEKVNPKRFGSRQFRGINALRNALIHDLSALNKHEMLLWDIWGMMLNNQDINFSLLDELSFLLVNEPYNVSKINKFYNEHPCMQVSNRIVVDNPLLAEKTELLQCF